MKKLTKSILAVVLTSSFVIVNAQEKKKTDQEKEREIEGVVVTAMGVSKSQKSVSYSVTNLKNEALEGRPNADPFKSLEGQVSGLNLNSVGGAVGSGGQLTIRGNNSIAGSNQALVVLDGVPLIGSSYSEDGFTSSGTTSSSRLSDIDPNNVAEITVLKGYAAATLYGTAGKNGVILIKTKSGSRGKSNNKMNVNLTQSFFVNQAVLPEYQNEYGMGTNNVTQGWFFSNWGAAFADKDLNNFFGGSIRGANGNIYLPHPYRTIPNAPDNFNSFGLRSEFPELQNALMEYKAYQSVENFFRPGSQSQTSVNISKNFEAGSIGSSFNYHNETGVIPNNTLRKFNLSVGGNAALNDRLDFAASINYSTKDYQTPPISAGYGSGISGNGTSILADVFYTPRNIDLMGMPFEGPISRRSVYYRANNGIQNPRWSAQYTKNIEKTERAILGSSLTYKIFKNASLKYGFGLDAVNQNSEYRIARGGVQSTLTNNGYYRTMNYMEKIFNHDLIFSMSKDDFLVQDLSMSLVVGGQAKRNTFKQFGLSSTGQDTFNYWEHSNFKTTSGKNLFNNADLDYRQNVNTLGVYASAEFGFKEMVYLSLQGRNDWTSVLEKDYRQIFYPSAGLSLVPTVMFPSLKSNMLNFMKLRYAYGSSGNFPSPYQTRNYLLSTNNAFVGGNGTTQTVNTQAVSSFLANPALKPEIYKENEFGVEAKLFNNRVSLNTSYFLRTTKDQIVPSVSLDPATGYSTTITNIARLDKNGLEIELGITPVRTENFKWMINNVFYRERSMVKELPVGMNKLNIAGFTNLGNFAVVGQPYGVIMGIGIDRDANGNPIVLNNGSYALTKDIKIIGNPNPDYNYTMINDLSYKGFELHVKMDYQKGGQIYSNTAASLLARGNTANFDRTNTFVLPGVKQDGTVNDIQVNPFHYFFDNYFGSDEIRVWDASHFRLSELTLGYNLPKKFLEGSPISALNISLVGNNVWYYAFNFPKEIRFDPSVSSTGVGNGRGFDFLTNVPIRRFGMSLKMSF